MEQTLNIAKALADGSRMRVIAALMSRDELCVCQITEMLQLAPATVSRHMTILQHARLVQSRKGGPLGRFTGLPPRFPTCCTSGSPEHLLILRKYGRTGGDCRPFLPVIRMISAGGRRTGRVAGNPERSRPI